MNNRHPQLPPEIPAAFTSEPGPTGIVLDVSKSPIQFGIKPLVKVDGRPIPNLAWGVNHIPARPGYHQVTVCISQLGMEYGPAHTIVPVAEGHTTRVYYRSPIERYVAGAIGPQPQATPGMAIVYAATMLTLVMVLAFVVMVVAR